jgi:hypothetical protein
MKFIPIALAGAMAFAMAVIFASVPAARAGDPIEVDQPAGGESSDPVLEIPQKCVVDGEQVACDQSNADPNSDATTASAADRNDSGQARNDNSQAGGSAAPSDAYADQGPTPNWGNVQDYQDQALVDGFVASSMAASTGPLGGRMFASPPILLPAPRPMAPFPTVRPFVATSPLYPRVMGATGPIGVPPAWMPAARPFAPMTIRPMMPAGMPHAFRVR